MKNTMANTLIQPIQSNRWYVWLSIHVRCMMKAMTMQMYLCICVIHFGCFLIVWLFFVYFSFLFICLFVCCYIHDCDYWLLGQMALSFILRFLFLSIDLVYYVIVANLELWYGHQWTINNYTKNTMSKIQTKAQRIQRIKELKN